MDFALTTYNNLVSLKSWSQPADRKEDDKFLAFMSEIKQEFSDLLRSDDLKNPKDSVPETALLSEPQYNRDRGKVWRFKNENNLKTMVKEGKTYYWCKSDCHRKPIWCYRKNCLSRADCKKKQDAEAAGNGKVTVSEDFKLALAAVRTTDDLETFRDQFLN